MKNFIFLISTLFFGSAFSQVKSGDSARIYEKYHTDVADPEFPGGINALRSELLTNFQTRKIVASGKIRTEITFIVERDGTMSEIKAVGDNESFNNESINAFKKIKDIWKPAKVNGVKVRSRHRLPLTMNFK